MQVTFYAVTIVTLIFAAWRLRTTRVGLPRMPHAA
jgi:hypothetical protein